MPAHPRRGPREPRRDLLRPGRRPRRRTTLEDAGTPRPRLTGRAAILVLVLAALMVSYASSFRAYLDQRRHIGDLRESIATSEADIAALKREKARWDDPAYVVAQARARFAFGFPGEIGYQVLDVDGRPLDHQDSLTDPAQISVADDSPEWWQRTLSSVEAAGHPRATPEPADRIAAPPESRAP